MYALVIIGMFDPKLGESLNLMADSMPGLFAAFGMSYPGNTLTEFLANYLYGFIFIVLPAVYIILTSNKLICGYVDKMSMSYLLSTPVKRSEIALTQALFLIISNILIIFYTVIIIFSATQIMFPGKLNTADFLLINTGLLGLIIFLSGLSFLFSCIFNESKYSVGFSGGCIAVFILTQMLAQTSDKFDFLKYLTPLTLYNARGLAESKYESIIMFIVLYAAGLVLFSIGIKIFRIKDIPV